MRNRMRLTTLAGTAMAVALALVGPVHQVQAQTRAAAAGTGGLFATAITVNGLGISNYDIDQRMRFMQVLRQTGDLRKQAEDVLIEDRLRVWQAGRDGVTVSDDDIKKGMAEFAGRANLSTEDFLAQIGQAGVEAGTFREFVRAGMLWRGVIRARIAPRVKITDADIDRALLVEAKRGQGTKVLMSEIILPAPPEHLAEARDIAQQVSKLKGDAAFAQAAEQVSASSSRDNGGRLDWMPLANLPPMLRPIVLALQPGQASAPVELNGAIGVFMLRGLQGGDAPKEAQVLGYATLALGPAGSPEASKVLGLVQANARSCDDLYTISRDQGVALSRVQPVSQNAIPQQIAVELAHLDIGETSVMSLGGVQSVVMLCSRQTAADAEAEAKFVPPPKTPQLESNVADSVSETETQPGGATRDQLRNRLTSERIGTLADNYLAELKADAVIIRK